jgi:hypothetical protein
LPFILPSTTRGPHWLIHVLGRDMLVADTWDLFLWSQCSSHDTLQLYANAVSVVVLLNHGMYPIFRSWTDLQLAEATLQQEHDATLSKGGGGQNNIHADKGRT